MEERRTSQSNIYFNLGSLGVRREYGNCLRRVLNYIVEKRPGTVKITQIPGTYYVQTLRKVMDITWIDHVLWKACSQLRCRNET